MSQPTRRSVLLSGAMACSWPTLAWSVAAQAGDDAAREDQPVPQSVTELWKEFDPRRDPLEVELIREWTESGGVFRIVRFLVGRFKGQPARMTAIYGFPEGTGKTYPAVMHIHGGGQRAFLHEVAFLVGRGYAALSVNWGGDGDGQPPFNQPDRSEPDDVKTDWGAVDPSQLNARGYQSLLPGPKQMFEDREHPQNCNWFLLTLGCRRGLTFLEQQPEVDADRLGVHGYSMGGNLTMYVAGADERVKAAVPAVGGAGWRWQPHPVADGTILQDHIQGDVDLFRRTLSFESYAPLIRCPILHRSGTNDFHGWMDDVYRTNSLIPAAETRYCWSPHLNHRLAPEVEVSMPLWFDQWLKGGPALPKTPESELILDSRDGVPRLRVRPDRGWKVARCETYYSVDADPRSRFWRSADVTTEGDTFLGALPLHSADRPLFAFSNVIYTLPEPVSLDRIPGHRDPVRELCLSSLFHTASTERLAEAGLKATLSPSPLIDDFRQGTRDWFVFNGNHPTLWQYWTRKLRDPLWRGADGARLKLTFRMAEANRLTVVVVENEWRNDRGPRRTYLCEREIPGNPADQSLVVSLADLVSADGPLSSWRYVDQLGLCSQFTERGQSPRPEGKWSGPAPVWIRLEWV